MSLEHQPRVLDRGSYARLNKNIHVGRALRIHTGVIGCVLHVDDFRRKLLIEGFDGLEVTVSVEDLQELHGMTLEMAEFLGRLCVGDYDGIPEEAFFLRVERAFGTGGLPEVSRSFLRHRVLKSAYRDSKGFYRPAMVNCYHRELVELMPPNFQIPVYAQQY